MDGGRKRGTRLVGNLGLLGVDRPRLGLQPRRRPRVVGVARGGRGLDGRTRARHCGGLVGGALHRLRARGLGLEEGRDRGLRAARRLGLLARRHARSDASSAVGKDRWLIQKYEFDRRCGYFFTGAAAALARLPSTSFRQVGRSVAGNVENAFLQLFNAAFGATQRRSSASSLGLSSTMVRARMPARPSRRKTAKTSF
jgi:hypothetical protein